MALPATSTQLQGPSPTAAAGEPMSPETTVGHRPGLDATPAPPGTHPGARPALLPAAPGSHLTGIAPATSQGLRTDRAKRVIETHRRREVLFQRAPTADPQWAEAIIAADPLWGPDEDWKLLIDQTTTEADPPAPPPRLDQVDSEEPISPPATSRRARADLHRGEAQGRTRGTRSRSAGPLPPVGSPEFAHATAPAAPVLPTRSRPGLQPRWVTPDPDRSREQQPFNPSRPAVTQSRYWTSLRSGEQRMRIEAAVSCQGSTGVPDGSSLVAEARHGRCRHAYDTRVARRRVGVGRVLAQVRRRLAGRQTAVGAGAPALRAPRPRSHRPSAPGCGGQLHVRPSRGPEPGRAAAVARRGVHRCLGAHGGPRPVRLFGPRGAPAREASAAGPCRLSVPAPSWAGGQPFVRARNPVGPPGVCPALGGGVRAAVRPRWSLVSREQTGDVRRRRNDEGRVPGARLVCGPPGRGCPHQLFRARRLRQPAGHDCFEVRSGQGCRAPPTRR